MRRRMTSRTPGFSDDGWLRGLSRLLATACAVFGVLVVCGVAIAQDGQEDLDKATEMKLTASSVADLEKVVELGESALKKGLDADNQEFAKQLVSSSLLEAATELSARIFDQQPPDPRWRTLRQAALKNLDKALKYDAGNVQIHLMIARLHSLPNGDKRRGERAASEVVRLSSGDKKQLSRALMLRALMVEEKDRRLGDLNQAVLVDPENFEALQARGLIYLADGEYAKAEADFAKVLESNANSLEALVASSEALTNLDKFDEALKQLDKVLELKPDAPMAYVLRSRVRSMKEDYAGALEDISKALEFQPEDLSSLLTRARLYMIQEDAEKARADVDKVLELQPGLPQAILLRSVLFAADGKFGEAIRDMEQLVAIDPENVEFRMQLARYCAGDERPRRAIEIYTELIEEDPSNWQALRGRGDSLLSVGKHAEAIADYEAALKIQPDDSGILNNLAWVLATSPEDSLRDSKRSIELGLKACEVTEYKRPHILSTLAAGYAEAGDWENALKWSTKAVELGEEELKDQLQKELDSYKEKKPWREKQDVKEKEPQEGETAPEDDSLKL